MRMLAVLTVVVWSLAAPGAEGGLKVGGAPMEEVRVQRVVVDPRTDQPIVVLQDLRGERVLPIWVGVFEANAIALEMRHITTPRPMTHDLIKNILGELKARVKRVIIASLRENTYYARIKLEAQGRELMLDSRPSDAIALALRAKAPIFAAATLLISPGKLAPGPAKAAALSRLGLRVQELTAALAGHFQAKPGEGVLVADVRAGSPAARQGMRRGDIIRQVGSKQVQDVESLARALAEVPQGGVVALQVLRGREVLSLRLRVGAPPAGKETTPGRGAPPAKLPGDTP
ncbi:MAG: bifunctional nuclease domain-containing protein [Nitrospinota bacterium]